MCCRCHVLQAWYMFNLLCNDTLMYVLRCALLFVVESMESCSCVFKMSYTESQAVFEKRVSAVGLDDDVKKALIDGGVQTLATLAFVSEYNPGSSSEKPLIDALETLLKREASVKEKAAFRRLFHESYAMVTNEMKLSVEKSDDSTSRKLSQPERHDRYVRQKRRLSGVSIKGPTEPSDALVDLCCSIYDGNRLKWIDWAKCASKEAEMTVTRKINFSL